MTGRMQGMVLSLHSCFHWWLPLIDCPVQYTVRLHSVCTRKQTFMVVVFWLMVVRCKYMNPYAEDDMVVQTRDEEAKRNTTSISVKIQRSFVTPISSETLPFPNLLKASNSSQKRTNYFYLFIYISIIILFMQFSSCGPSKHFLWYEMKSWEIMYSSRDFRNRNPYIDNYRHVYCHHH